MQIQGEAYCVTVYIGESDRHRGQPLYMALLELLKREGGAGATVVRGLAGFGANSRIHTATIVTLSSDLPIIVRWVDQKERVERLLPVIQSMVRGGLITLESVQVIYYAPLDRQAPLEASVRSIMRTEVTAVHPDTPLGEVLTLLLQRGYRSVPVVDATHHVVGILTDGDLLQRAHLSLRLGLQPLLTAEALRNQLAELERQDLRVAAVMTQPVITVRADDTVRKAASLMVEHGLKRLPVVDAAGILVGWVSRLDILRRVAYHASGENGSPKQPAKGASVAELMDTAVPTVGPEATQEEVLAAMEMSRGQRVVVVDDQRRVLGILTDGDLLQRSELGKQPGFLARLRGIVSGEASRPRAAGQISTPAKALMTTPVVTVQLDTPLIDALDQMLSARIKRLPVVDDQGRLVGLLGRASVLHGLLAQDKQVGSD